MRRTQDSGIIITTFYLTFHSLSLNTDLMDMMNNVIILLILQTGITILGITRELLINASRDYEQT